MPSTRLPFLLAAALLAGACSSQRAGTAPSRGTAGPDARTASAQPPALTNVEFLEAYAATNRFRLGQPTAIKVAPGGNAVLFLRAQGPRSFVQDLWTFDIATGRERVLLTADQILRGAEERLSADELARRERARSASRGIAAYDLSKDGKRILVPLSGRLYVIDREQATSGTLALQELPAEGGFPIDARFSPDGTMVACVRDGALYVIDLSMNAQRRVSPAPEPGVSYGEAEFVAQEEMDRSKGYWWSPDSARIVFQRTDTNGMEVFSIADAFDPAKPAQTWPYPRAGGKNADVTLWVADARDAGAPPVEIAWDRTTYPYLARVVWSRHGPLSILVQARDQREQVLYAADEPRGGRLREILRERDDAWINLAGEFPEWLQRGGFLWMTEQEGDAWRVVHHKPDGSRTVIADAPLVVQDVIGVDEQRGVAILNDAYHNPGTSVVAVPIDPASGPEMFEPGCIGEAGQVSAVIDDGLSTWVRTTNRLQGDPAWEVMRADRVVGTLNSIADRPTLAPRVEVVSLGGERDFKAAVIRPTDFDASERYPVLNFVYGGPHSNQVNANARAYLLHQWYADQGFIVVTIDGRGTPRRGRAWERSVRGDLIGPPLQDQCEAMAQLFARYPEMDASRVGVYGWSFGGYFSAMAAMRRPDVFDCAVAGAPVADWIDYDTHYTERYLGIPDRARDAYAVSNVLTYCKDLSVPLMVVHGTADDNVYPVHSLKLTDALFKAGKRFEFVPLAGQTHAVSRPEFVVPLHKRIAAFFRLHLTR